MSDPHALHIRPEGPHDAPAIGRVTEQAFQGAAHSSGTEALIVAALRAAGQLTVSLVAQSGDQIVGHVAISPVLLTPGGPGWHGLGPLSVRPDWQRRGVGSRLMAAALARLRALDGAGSAGCVLLGDPAYYTRFGFRPYPQLLLPGVPAEYFMALPFDSEVPGATVRYHVAFDVGPAPH